MRVRLLPIIATAVLIVAVLSIPMGLAVPARAQDGGGLTAEELALLDRVFTARQNFKALTSHQEIINGVQTRELKLINGAATQAYVTKVSWKRTSEIINQGDVKNIRSTLSVTVENQSSGTGAQQKSSVYTIIADVRRVDGKLYINAKYDADQIDPTWPELPTGWVEVTDIGQWAGFRELNLRDYINETSIFDDPEGVKAANPDVSSEASTLDDGTPVDIITVTFSAEGVKALRADTPDSSAFATALMDNLSGDTHARLTAAVGADNLPRQAEAEEVWQATGIDASVLGQSQIPAGTTLDYASSSLRTVSYDYFNATLDPVTVPEELAK